MSDFKVTLDSAGIREMLKSDDMLNHCRELGSQVLARCGDNYEMEDRHYPERNGVAIRPSNYEGIRDNLKNNTLLKAVR